MTDQNTKDDLEQQVRYKQTWKKSKELIDKVLDGLKMGMTRKSAAGYAGISRQTLHQRIKTDEAVLTLVENAEDYRMALVENQKAKLINKGHWGAIEKELKSRREEVYGDRSTIDMTLHNQEVIDESLLR